MRLPATFTAATADEAFDRGNGASWMMRPLAQGSRADAYEAVVRIANSTRRASAAVFISQQDREAAIDDTDERIRRAEIDAEDGGGGRFRFQDSIG